MAKEYVLSAVLELKDKMTVGIKNARQGLSSLQSGIESVKTDKMQNELQRAGAASDKLRQQIGGLKSMLQSVSGTHSITIDARDNATDKARRAASAVKTFSSSGNRSVQLNAHDQASPIITRLKEQLTALTGKPYAVNIRANAGAAISKAGNAVSGVASGMLMNTSAQMAGAAGIGYGIYDTIKTYQDFEAQMSKVGAISGATGAEMDTLTAKAKEMGATTQFSATEAGQALQYMAMAGWKTDDMLSGISGVMDLAAASGESLASVSDIVTDALTAFGLKAQDAAHFSDVLAAASSNSNTNVSMMGMTFKYAAPIAGALGYSIEDVAVATGLMANAGIKGEMAGTALRSTMTRLVDPPKDAADALNQLGISVKNQDGSVKPLMRTMEELRDRFSGLSDSEKTQLASSIAGQEAMSGFLAIVNASEDDFEKLCKSIDNADGASARMAATMNDNLSGDLKALSSVWESFQLELMSGKGGEGIREFVQGVRSDLEKFTGYIKDGFDISDVGKLAMDVLTQLKNKFFALDGVGSVLAGGALAAGLAKITKLTLKAVDGLKSLSKVKGGTGGSSLSGSSSVGEMIVNASTVIVNGKGITDSGAGTSVGGSEPASKGSKASKGIKGASRLSRASKALGGVGAALGLAFGAYDAYNTYQSNQTLSEEADSGLAAAQESGSAEDIANAEAYKVKVERQNTDRMGSSLGTTAGGFAGGIAGAKVGAMAGGAIGSAFGGIGAVPGAVVGGLVGGVAGAIGGSELGNAIGGNSAEISETAGNAWQTIKGGASEAVNSISETWTAFTTSAKEFFSPVVMAVEDGINVIVGIGATMWEFIEPYWEEFASFASSIWQGISTMAGQAWSFISGIWSSVAEWFESTIWEPISSLASSAWQVVYDMANQAWSFISGVWSPVAGWFESTIWSPISSAVSGVKTAIVDAFNGALSTVKGAWSGLTGWFESNIVGPISKKFAELREKGAKITGLSGSGGGDGGGDGSWTGSSFFTPSFWTGGIMSAIPAFASGITSFAPANVAHGLAQINEHGGELIDLPQGSRIYPAATTQRLIERQLEDETPTSPSINITGNTFVVREEADIQKIAHELFLQIMQAQVNYGGAY